MYRDGSCIPECRNPADRGGIPDSQQRKGGGDHAGIEMAALASLNLSSEDGLPHASRPWCRCGLTCSRGDVARERGTSGSNRHEHGSVRDPSTLHSCEGRADRLIGGGCKADKVQSLGVRRPLVKVCFA